MKVFVAGATGAIGRPLVRKLIAAGHEVTGMTRSAERGEELRAVGGRPALCDVYDADAVRDSVVSAGADAVVHQLTALPAVLDMRRADLYEETNRLRTEGSANLLAAADAAGATRFVAQSIAFAYEPEGDWVKGENAPLMRKAVGPFAGAVKALGRLEGDTLGAGGVVLRYGNFYGPGTFYAPDGHFAREAARRRLPVVGRGTGRFSFIHVEDAAEATVAAIEAPDASGVFNVTDDEPAPMHDWIPGYAKAIGAPRPLRIPRWLAAIAAGRLVADMAVTLRGASNARARAELGWRPLRPTWREGFAELADSPG